MINQLLEMIETVDPKDTAKLDEIDARVWCYLGGEHWGRIEPVKFLYFGPTETENLYGELKIVCGLTFSYKGKFPHEAEYRDCTEFMTGFKKYTRSRDALKQIRPKGWDIHIKYWPTELGKNRAYAWIEKDKKQFRYSLPNEELAELHAILQAIDFERKQNEHENHK
jgi:hypothetical protein